MRNLVPSIHVVLIVILAQLERIHCAPQEPLEAEPVYTHDGYVLLGDIAVTPEQYAIYKESGWNGLLQSEAWNGALWPTTIPYEIDAGISELDSKYTMHR